MKDSAKKRAANQPGKSKGDVMENTQKVPLPVELTWVGTGGDASTRLSLVLKLRSLGAAVLVEADSIIPGGMRLTSTGEMIGPLPNGNTLFAPGQSSLVYLEPITDTGDCDQSRHGVPLFLLLEGDKDHFVARFVHMPADYPYRGKPISLTGQYEEFSNQCL